MDRTTFKGNKVERDRHKKQTDALTRKLSKTETGGVRLADQVGPIKTKLTDVNVELEAAKKGIFESVKKAGSEDAAIVQKEERSTKEHQKAIQELEQQSAGEQRKAEAIRSADSRMKGGEALAQKLKENVRGLVEIKQELSNLASKAEAQRKKSSLAIESAIRRNKK